MKDRKNIQDPSEKVELAKKIASQGKKVSNSYATVEENFFRIFRWFSSLIDRLFFAQKYLKVVALVLAVMFYFIVNYNEDSLFATPLSSAKTLSNVNVTARYNSESFELSGLPSACEVVLTGEAANVNNAASRTGYCLINLEGYTEGTHSVQLVARGYGENVSAVVTPSQANITLKRKTTAQFELDYDFINQNQLDSKYILGTPVFADGNKANIRASQDTLDSIAFVKALIDVTGQSGDFEVEAPLVAYNKQGQAVDAEILPSTVKVKVSVTSPHKTVPIILNVTGEVPNGLAIDTIQMDHQTTTIYAPEDVLMNVNQVVVDYDASTLLRDTEVIQPVVLPEGVSGSDVTKVNLKVALAAAETKVIEDVPIIYRNNDRGYGATDITATTTNVNVTGTANNIATVSENDLVVYIDIKDLEPGTYDLPLKLEYSANPYVRCSLEDFSIGITLIAQE